MSLRTSTAPGLPLPEFRSRGFLLPWTYYGYVLPSPSPRFLGKPTGSMCPFIDKIMIAFPDATPTGAFVAPRTVSCSETLNRSTSRPHCSPRKQAHLYADTSKVPRAKQLGGARRSNYETPSIIGAHLERSSLEIHSSPVE